VRLYILLILAFLAVPARAEPAVILVFGDSISAGFGLSPPDKGWVTLLQNKLKTEGYGYRVVNASVSGETTAGGLTRLPRALDVHHPKIVIVELGGNDGLRALPVPVMRANLAKMTDLSRSAGAAVLILGMRMPPNYGEQYTAQFASAFGEVAKEGHAALMPFLLDRIALEPELMQADGIHPNELGQPRLLANVWPALLPLLRKGTSPAGGARLR
jgi:acyl-CoA thioesterase-1